MKYRWDIATQKPTEANRLACDLGVSDLLAQCLLNRGLTNSNEARRFLKPQLKNLAHPLELPNMKVAIHRLFEAREAGEKVLIFGDYDADGISATALLFEVLSELGWSVESYLPHRLNEGYGLSRAAVSSCLERFSPSVFLAVDCGSNAAETIEYLGQKGIDVIVLDHHQIARPLPQSVAFVNPQLNGGPFCELSAVGLAFKLAHAIVMNERKHNQQDLSSEYDLKDLLDLVALGTVADLVPLIGENRIMVSAGLKRLGETRRTGLLALMEVAGVKGPIGVFEIGFQLGPRINASGRLGDAMASLALLLCSDFEKAKAQARKLDECNRQRQQIEKAIANEATQSAQDRFDPERDFVIVEANAHWHSGVVGIVASRVLRAFYRPTIILGGEGKALRGSGRSIEGFDLAEALRACDDLLLAHGGHSMAAGLSLLPERLPAFQKRINEYARDHLPRKCLLPLLHLDAIVSLDKMALPIMEELLRLKPFGAGNAPLQFAAQKLALQKPPLRMGKGGEHAKFWIEDGNAQSEVLWWNCGKKELPSGCFDLAFVPQINDYNGRRSIQLKLLDWKPAS